MLLQLGANAQHIPYQGGLTMLGNLLQQRLTFGVLSVQLAQKYVRQQQMPVLAVTGATRSPQMPDVLALSKTYPGFSTASTAYLMAAPGMEPCFIQSDHDIMAATHDQQRFASKAGRCRHGRRYENNVEASWLIRQETEHWGQILRHVGGD